MRSNKELQRLLPNKHFEIHHKWQSQRIDKNNKVTHRSPGQSHRQRISRPNRTKNRYNKQTRDVKANVNNYYKHKSIIPSNYKSISLSKSGRKICKNNTSILNLLNQNNIVMSTDDIDKILKYKFLQNLTFNLQITKQFDIKLTCILKEHWIKSFNIKPTKPQHIVFAQCCHWTKTEEDMDLDTKQKQKELSFDIPDEYAQIMREMKTYDHNIKLCKMDILISGYCRLHWNVMYLPSDIVQIVILFGNIMPDTFPYDSNIINYNRSNTEDLLIINYREKVTRIHRKDIHSCDHYDESFMVYSCDPSALNIGSPIWIRDKLELRGWSWSEGVVADIIINGDLHSLANDVRIHYKKRNLLVDCKTYLKSFKDLKTKWWRQDRRWFMCLVLNPNDYNTSKLCLKYRYHSLLPIFAVELE